MLIERWVAGMFAILMIVVSGGGKGSFVLPTETTRSPITAPTPPIVESTTTTVASTTTTEPHVEGGQEPRYDLPVLAGIENALCPEWWHLAVDVGWTVEQLPTLDLVMWNEARCQEDVVSRTNDYGLVQVNRGVWKTVVEEHGWTMDDLLIARNGLAMGLIVYNAAEDMGWCGWSPWFMSGDYCA